MLSAHGADFKAAQDAFRTGNYPQAIAWARQGVAAQPDDEDWQLLLARVLLTTGRYPEALKAMTNALAQNRWSIRLCWEARAVFLSNGQVDAAAEMPDRIIGMVSRHPRDFSDAADLVVFGRAALATGADPKRVLDSVFSAALKMDHSLEDAYEASGQLALEKHDFALAAKRFEDALKILPDEPGLHCGLARAYAPSDQALMLASLEKALEINSNHVPSLLLLSEHEIDAEAYTEAGSLLDRVLKINPWNPDAWAYRAVLAELHNQPEAAEKARETALKYWPANPRVDFLLGQKLSQNYRFAQGAAHQRQALKFDPDYLPAKAQLAQDLLRLGQESEGWGLAEEVQKQDNYDVQAYNLSVLRETMRKFATLTNQDFILRMSSREVPIYGASALALLERAKATLCAKYGLDLTNPTIVEIFPDQKDFGVRTFGMPGNPDFLGVCFGNLITANSPASYPGQPFNWQAVLWHEFCHVVTLHLTQNKMPRWLSEGISVYEERQANPAWGEHMNPDYRQMVLGNDFTPISHLSAAFLTPRSALHLQFAYYESSLVVDFLVQRFGLDKLKAILHDLANGEEINTAIERHTLPMGQLEQAFSEFARRQAEQLAPGLDWTQPKLAATGNRHSPADSDADDAFAKWSAAHPTNFYALTGRAERLIEQKQFEAAKAPLEELLKLFPGQLGPDSAAAMLAAVHHELGETNAERQLLQGLAEREDDALEVYQRLMELDAAFGDWPGVRENARRYLAVNPLVDLPYQFLAQAAEKTGDTASAIDAYRALLQFDPSDPASVHFELARALHRQGDPGALRQVLQALEEAPGYRDALHLLLELKTQQTGT